MTQKMKRSTADLIRAVLFALCALTWLPNWPVEWVSWFRIVLPIVCAAIAVWSLLQYFKNRKMERGDT